MSTSQIVKLFVGTGIAFFAIDLVWLGVIAPAFYQRHLEFRQFDAVNSVPSSRVRLLNAAPVRRYGKYVLYWMVASRRTRFNFGLQRAVDRARGLATPLVVLEALRCDYPWACERFHRFVIDGMADNAERFRRLPGRDRRLSGVHAAAHARGRGVTMRRLPAPIPKRWPKAPTSLLTGSNQRLRKLPIDRSIGPTALSLLRASQPRMGRTGDRTALVLHRGDRARLLQDPSSRCGLASTLPDVGFLRGSAERRDLESQPVNGVIEISRDNSAYGGSRIPARPQKPRSP
jgi:hypothetical protein